MQYADYQTAPAMIEVREGDHIFMKHNPDMVYQFILQYMQAKQGASPVYSQIMAACHIGSLSTVSRILRGLEKQGKIQIETKMGSRPIIMVTGARWVPPGDSAQ